MRWSLQLLLQLSSILCTLATCSLAQPLRRLAWEGNTTYYQRDQDDPLQAAALWSLYNSTGGPSWTLPCAPAGSLLGTNSSREALLQKFCWDDSISYCHWLGVLCCATAGEDIYFRCAPNSTQSVAILDLAGVGLQGRLPSSLGTLPDLQYLFLQDNPQLVGSFPVLAPSTVQRLQAIDLANTSLQCYGNISTQDISSVEACVPSSLVTLGPISAAALAAAAATGAFVCEPAWLTNHGPDAKQFGSDSRLPTSLTFDPFFFNYLTCSCPDQFVKAYKPSNPNYPGGKQELSCERIRNESKLVSWVLPVAITGSALAVVLLTGLLLRGTLRRALLSSKHQRHIKRLKQQNAPGSLKRSDELAAAGLVWTADGQQEVTMVLTDVEGSTELWEWDEAAMNSAIELHDKMIRTTLAKHCGYEVTTEGDSFTLAFHTSIDAVRWMINLQVEFLTINWPQKLYQHPRAKIEASFTGSTIFRGLRVRAAANTGVPRITAHNVTGILEYGGECVELAEAFSTQGCGGQVLIGHTTYARMYSQLNDLCTSPDTLAPTDFLGALRGSMREGNLREPPAGSQVAPAAPAAEPPPMHTVSVKAMHTYGLPPSLPTSPKASKPLPSAKPSMLHRVAIAAGNTLRRLAVPQDPESDMPEIDQVEAEWLGSNHREYTLLKETRPIVIDMGSYLFSNFDTSARALRERQRTTGIIGHQMLQLLHPLLADRVHFFPIPSSESQVSPSFFDAPGSELASYGASLPPPSGAQGKITITFCTVANFSTMLAHNSTVAEQALQTYNACVRATILFGGGYECQEKNGIFMLAFPNPRMAVEWGVTLQLAMLLMEWNPELLHMRDASEVKTPEGNLLFRGLRCKVGIFEGEMSKVTPHYSTGRADYFGQAVNRAARIMSGAVPGQVLTERSIADNIAKEWGALAEASNGIMPASLGNHLALQNAKLLVKNNSYEGSMYSNSTTSQMVQSRNDSMLMSRNESFAARAQTAGLTQDHFPSRPVSVPLGNSASPSSATPPVAAGLLAQHVLRPGSMAQRMSSTAIGSVAGSANLEEHFTGHISTFQEVMAEMLAQQGRKSVDVTQDSFTAANGNSTLSPDRSKHHYRRGSSAMTYEGWEPLEGLDPVHNLASSGLDSGVDNTMLTTHPPKLASIKTHNEAELMADIAQLENLSVTTASAHSSRKQLMHSPGGTGVLMDAATAAAAVARLPREGGAGQKPRRRSKMEEVDGEVEQLNQALQQAQPVADTPPESLARRAFPSRPSRFAAADSSMLGRYSSPPHSSASDSPSASATVLPSTTARPLQPTTASPGPVVESWLLAQSVCGPPEGGEYWSPHPAPARPHLPGTTSPGVVPPGWGSAGPLAEGLQPLSRGNSYEDLGHAQASLLSALDPRSWGTQRGPVAEGLQPDPSSATPDKGSDELQRPSPTAAAGDDLTSPRTSNEATSSPQSHSPRVSFAAEDFAKLHRHRRASGGEHRVSGEPMGDVFTKHSSSAGVFPPPGAYQQVQWDALGHGTGSRIGSQTIGSAPVGTPTRRMRSVELVLGRQPMLVLESLRNGVSSAPTTDQHSTNPARLSSLPTLPESSIGTPTDRPLDRWGKVRTAQTARMAFRPQPQPRKTVPTKAKLEVMAKMSHGVAVKLVQVALVDVGTFSFKGLEGKYNIINFTPQKLFDRGQHVPTLKRGKAILEEAGEGPIGIFEIPIFDPAKIRLDIS